MSEPGVVQDEERFETFVHQIERPLLAALVAALGPQRGRDAHSAALEYAWTHRERVMALRSPVAYLTKVGRSAARDRRRRPEPMFPDHVDGSPEFEPGLAAAVAALPERQRTAVFLVVGCRYSVAEVARMHQISESSVRTHVERGMARLRVELGSEDTHD